MSYLLDTNVLVRALLPAHPKHAEAKAAIKELVFLGEELIVVAQNCYELWVVTTRPVAQNGLDSRLLRPQ